MARKTERKQIGDRGYTYAVTQFGGREGGKWFLRLAKLIGKPVGEAVAAGKATDANAQTIGRVIAGLAGAADPEEFDALTQAFSACTTVTGKDYPAQGVSLGLGDVYDQHFAGAYLELGSWLAFCVEVNYGSFLAVIGPEVRTSLRDLGLESQPSPSQSPTT